MFAIFVLGVDRIIGPFYSETKALEYKRYWQLNGIVRPIEPPHN